MQPLAHVLVRVLCRLSGACLRMGRVERGARLLAAAIALHRRHRPAPDHEETA